jgi:hypothetical protein
MKTCSKCKTEKDESEFNKKRNRLQERCRTCQANYQKEWYLANKNNRRKQIYARRKSNGKDFWNKLNEIKRVPCADCKQQYKPWQMDFDHLHDKSFGISGGIKQGYGWEAVLAEVAKCEVVCANCHRDRTHQRRIALSSNGKTVVSETTNHEFDSLRGSTTSRNHAPVAPSCESGGTWR